MKESASAIWTRLSANSTGLITRLERYASYTIPKLMLGDGFDHVGADQTHDYQSIGAQAVNHVTNKMMLAMFRPSAPFFRLQLNAVAIAAAAANGMTEEAVGPILAKMERDASKLLDARMQRPKLYTALRNLIVLGNVLLVLDKEALRVMSIKYWRVKRTLQGKVHTLAIHERVAFDELDQDVKVALPNKYRATGEQVMVSYYKIIKLRPAGNYVVEQWVDETHLDQRKFGSKYPEDKLPFRVLTWDLADEADYATGLVEEYSGDLEAVSILSEAVVDGAVSGCDWRWLVNPTGITTVDDIKNSKSGDAIPGTKADLETTSGGNAEAVARAMSVMSDWEKRIARGFLMLSAVTRDAERVTAEEVRLLANELDTAYGGVYSALSGQIQKPIAEWLLREAGTDVIGKDVEVQVITGLDALSRNGDLEAFRLAMGDLAQITSLPPELQGRIKFNEIAKFVGAGRGIDLSPYLKNEEEYAAYLQQLQESRVQESTATAAGEAAAQEQE
jgi:hypothetical protein